MMIIPFQIPSHEERGPLVVFVVLEKENLERMRKGDPCDLQFTNYKAFLPVEQPISQLDLVIAYEEDKNSLMKFKAANDIAGLLKWLERGRKHQPGDLVPPVRL